MSLQTSTATSAQQHPVYPVFTPDGHYAPYAAPEQLNASATTSPSAVPLPFASLPRPLVVQASSPTPSISGAPSSPTISRPGTAPSTPIVTASSLQVVRHANPTTPSRPTSQLDRQMHTKYLETRGERLSEALATAESERQRLSDEKEQMMLFGRRLAYDHQMAKARNTELVLTESRVRRERDEARAQCVTLVATEARLRQERDDARAQLADRIKECALLRDFAREKHVELQAGHQEKQNLDALRMENEALRAENQQLKQTGHRIIQKARAQFAHMQAQLREAKLAAAATVANPTTDRPPTPTTDLPPTPTMDLPPSEEDPAAPATVDQEPPDVTQELPSSSPSLVLTPRATPTPPKCEPVQVPIPKAEPLDLEPKSEPKTEADEKPPSLSDSKFYTWDPPDPDRKRPRAKYEEEDDVKVEAGVERAAQRPRYEQEGSKLLISVKAENVKAEEGEESDSSAISMGPAFPIPRELNFDVKTQTSPVHYFMEIRRKTEGG